VGLLLRVSYELDRTQRQVARLRGEGAAPAAPPAPMPATTQPGPSLAARGTSRLRQRIQPRLSPGPRARSAALTIPTTCRWPIARGGIRACTSSASEAPA